MGVSRRAPRHHREMLPLRTILRPFGPVVVRVPEQAPELQLTDPERETLPP